MLNLFKKLFSENNNKKQKDLRKAECPYCKKELLKIPGAKTKCPHCGEFMFVRTRPKDNARLVVTKKEAEQIDEDWATTAGTHDIFVAEKEEFEKEKSILKKRFGGVEPSNNDVRWGILNKNLIKNAQNGDWGSYRCTRFEMGEVLRNEMKFKISLKTYLEVCYLDLSGANNMSGIDPEFRDEFPAFDSEMAFLAPGVVDLIRMLEKRLLLGKEELKNIFIEHNSRVEKSLNLPLSPLECWESLNKELLKNK